MDSIFDQPAATASTQAEVKEVFERIWGELRRRENAAPNCNLARDKVWLECNGELVDTESVVAIGIREPVPGAELVKYFCPRCGKSHESLRFR